MDRLSAGGRIRLALRYPRLICACDMRKFDGNEAELFVSEYEKLADAGEAPKFRDVEKAVILIRIPAMRKFFDAESLTGIAWLCAQTYGACPESAFRDKCKIPYIYEKEKYFEYPASLNKTRQQYVEISEKVGYKPEGLEFDKQLYELWEIENADCPTDEDYIEDGFYTNPETGERTKIEDYFQISQLREYFLILPEILFLFQFDKNLQDVALKFYRRMLSENPEYAAKVNIADIDWEKRSGFIGKFKYLRERFYYGDLEFLHASFLFEKFPQLIDKFDLHDFDGNDACLFINKSPQCAELFDWNKFCGESCVNILLEHPELAKYVDIEKIDGFGWSFLLKKNSMFDDKCNWKTFSAVNLEYLLGTRPETAKKCRWNDIPISEWGEFCNRNPDYLKYFDFEKLSDSDLQKVAGALHSKPMNLLRKKSPRIFRKILRNKWQYRRPLSFEELYLNRYRELKNTEGIAETEQNNRDRLKIETLRSLSDIGCGKAKFLLSNAYWNGEYGLKEDKQIALKLLFEAADAQDCDAENTLSLFFDKGYLGIIDRIAAIYWNTRAYQHHAKKLYFIPKIDEIPIGNVCAKAACGNPEAFVEISGIYARLYAEKKSDNHLRRESLLWLQKAVDANYTEAKFLLGLIFSMSDEIEDISPNTLKNIGLALMEECDKKGYTNAELPKEYVETFGLLR